MVRVQVDGVHKHYGRLAVLKGISLCVEPGEFVVLLGPSGCGKSTLLHAIAGLDDIDGGTIRIADRDVTLMEPKDRDIAMVFQSYALYPTMTVRRNMSFGLRMAGTSRQVVGQRVGEAAALLQIADLLDRKPGQLSGGQRQRVAIGRAIVRKASVFLFDEPLSNLDAKLRTDMRIELKRLHNELGATMIYVTHDQVEAMTMASRIAVLRGGAIEQYDTPQTLYDRPGNLFVAGFVGSPPMNMLPGHLRLRGDAVCVEAGGAALQVPRYPFRAPPTDGASVVLGFRPEDARVTGAELDEGTLPATLLSNEPLGPETLAWAAVGDGRVCVRMSPREAQAVGGPIAIRPDPARLSLFAAATGLRL